MSTRRYKDRDGGRHVVMVTSEYLPEVFGGAEQQCRKLSLELVRRGHAVTVLCSATQRDLLPHEDDQGIAIRRLHSARSPQQGGVHIASSVSFIRRVVRWIAERHGEIDLVHAHQAKVNAVAAVAAARRAQLPCLVKVGSAGDHKFDFYALERKFPVIGPWAAHYVRDHADRVVAISTDLVGQIGRYGVAAERIEFIPNGVLLPDLAAACGARMPWREARGFAPDDLVMAFTGRLAFDKNLEVLIDAAARAMAAAPRLRLLIVGDGEARAALEARASGAGIAARTVFAGRSETVDKELAASDLFVLPARAEGMSNALLEAMSLARPALCSRVSGNVDLVSEGKTGWLFEPSDVATLAARMTEAAAMSSSALRTMGAAGRRFVEEHHDMAHIASRYIALYDKLCRHPGERA